MIQQADLAALAEFFPAANDSALGDATAEDEAQSRLADLLYQEWYLQATKPIRSLGPPEAVEVNLVGALEAGHVASGLFEMGWTAQRSSNAGRVQANDQSDSPELQMTRTLRLGEYVNLSAPGRRPRSGDALAVSQVQADVEDGFWVVRSKQWWRLSASGSLPSLSRVYFNVDLAHTTHAVRALSRALDRWNGPFAFKVSMGLHELQRPDSVVLYLPRDDFHREVRDLLRPVVHELDEQSALGDACPRLTARLHGGVAAADGNADGASFGTDRCRLVAGALRGAADPHDIEALVHDAFLQAGLDPQRPYLEGGETRDYVAFDHPG